jgi:acyl dehydratase
VERFFEDFSVGERFEAGPIVVSAASIEAFLEYDPQVFHRAADAPSTRFGRLIASGWQTASYGMRLMVDSGIFGTNGAIGLGAEELRWTRPVYAGDALRLAGEIVGLRALVGKGSGIVTLRNEVRNQHGEVVMTERVNALMDARPSPPGLGRETE